jgi:hypothetical protein
MQDKGIIAGRNSHKGLDKGKSLYKNYLEDWKTLLSF